MEVDDRHVCELSNEASSSDLLDVRHAIEMDVTELDRPSSMSDRRQV